MTQDKTPSEADLVELIRMFGYTTSRQTDEIALAVLAKRGSPVVAGEVVATVIKRGADRQWMSERLGSLPDGIYSLYLNPQPTHAQAGAVALTCEWTHNHDDGFWETACGEAWRFDDGGPAENSMHFCHSCGKSLCIKEGGQHADS